MRMDSLLRASRLPWNRATGRPRWGARRTDLPSGPPSLGPLARRWYCAVCLAGIVAIAGPSQASAQPVDLEADDVAEVAQPAPTPRPGGLRRILESWFGGPRGNEEPGAAGQPTDGNSDSPGPRDAIDNRVGADSRLTAALNSAKSALKERDWPTAVSLLQQVLNAPEEGAIRSRRTTWTGSRQSALELLLSLPDDQRDAYRNRFEGEAKGLLADPQFRDQPNDANALVATRYLLTNTGSESADRLARFHYDRGEFGLANWWNQWLWRAQAPLVNRPEWKLQAAFVARLAGETLFSREVADTLPATVAWRGQMITAQSALDQLSAKVPARVIPELSARHLLYAAADRLAYAPPIDPRVDVEWTTSLVANEPLRARVRTLRDDLLEEGSPVIPASLAISHGPWLFLRDLRTVRAVNIATGQTVWETREGVSAEQILTGSTSRQVEFENRAAQMPGPRNLQNWDDVAANADQHPLTSLLYRDGVHGQLSCDGQRLFVIEEHGLLTQNQPGNYELADDDTILSQDGLPWKHNRLTAYGLTTGRIAWSIGGAPTKEAFASPLSGTFFHGVPTPSERELLVIGSRNDEERLWALDPLTGAPRWSVRLAYNDVPIHKDLARRWIAALPSVGQGVIVCPTTQGWLVGIDRQRRSVLWSTRYSEPTSSEFDNVYENHSVLASSLSSEWGTTAPLIHGKTVVYAAREADRLVGVDLISGQVRWSTASDGMTNVVGQTDEHVLVMGRELRALDPSTGRAVWTVRWDQPPSTGSATNAETQALQELKQSLQNGFPRERFTGSLARVLPAGRAVVTRDQVIVPLSSNELLVVDHHRGEVLERHPVGEPLGNLLVSEGRLMSQRADQLSAFVPRAQLLQTYRTQLQQDPQSPEANYRLARMELHASNWAAALDYFRLVRLEGLPEPDRAVAQRERFSALLVSARLALQRGEALPSDELQQWATDPADRLLLHELLAEAALQRGDYVAAFDEYWRLREMSEPAWVDRLDDSSARVRRKPWLQGRLQDVWEAAKTAEQAQGLNQHIEAIWNRVRPESISERDVLIEWLGFHPRAYAARLEQSRAAELIIVGDLIGGELALLQALETAGSHRPRVLAALAWFYERIGLTSDSDLCWTRLAGEFGHAPAAQVIENLSQTPGAEASPLSVADWVTAHLATRAASLSKAKTDLWPAGAAELTQHGYYQQPASLQLGIDGDPLPYWSDWQIECLQNESRLLFRSLTDPGSQWSTPLRVGNYSFSSNSEPLITIGHLLLVRRSLGIELVSPLTRRVVWSHLTSSNSRYDEYSGTDAEHVAPVISQSEGPRSYVSRLSQRPLQRRLYPVATATSVVCVSRRELTALDTRTGEVRWSRDDLTNESEVVHWFGHVVVVEPQRRTARAYRLSDGKLVRFDKLYERLDRTIVDDEQGVVELLAGAPLSVFGLNLGGAATLRRINPATDEVIWTRPLPAGFGLVPLHQTDVLVIQNSGAASLVNTRSGTLRELEADAKSGNYRAENSFAVLNRGRVTLFRASPNDWTNQGAYDENMPTRRFQGEITCWDHRTGKRLWTQAISDQFLLTVSAARLPLWIFVSRTFVSRANASYASLQLTALNQSTGERVIEQTLPVNHGNLNQVVFDPQTPSIDLLSYSSGVQIQPRVGGDGPPRLRTRAVPNDRHREVPQPGMLRPKEPNR